jgi:hypothetical protein
MAGMVVLLVVFVSLPFMLDMCGEGKEPPARVDIDDTLVEAADSSDVYFRNLKANVPWEAAVHGVNESWCSVTPPAGIGDATLTITLKQNLSITPREALILVTSEHFETQVITVNQAASAPYGKFGVNGLRTGHYGGDHRVWVGSNVKWRITRKSASWCTIRPMEGEGNAVIHIILDDNTTGKGRSIILSLQGEDFIGQDIFVHQEADK